MKRGDMPEELRERLPHDVRQYVRNFWEHPADPDRPYDFYDDTGEKFFHYLADEDGPLMPSKWGDIVVLLFARGCLKTTVCTAIANWACDVYGPKNIEGIVTAPRRDQTEEVMIRFERAAEQSGLDKFKTRDKRSHQEFKHTYRTPSGEKKEAYSDLKSRSAWNEGDALRGIHAHFGVVDEFQDVDEGMFSVFLETVDRQVPDVDYFPVIFVIGTPKLAGSFFHKLWEMSDKKTWDDDKQEWVQQDEQDEYLPLELKERKDEIETELDGYRRELHGLAREQWESEDPDFSTEPLEGLYGLMDELEEEKSKIRGFSVTGWHIDQYDCPRHSENSIAFKRATYSKRKFENEVLANFYSPENDLLTDQDVRSTFVDDGWRARPIDPAHDTFLGVDWGGGDGEGAASTVLTVFEEMDDGTLYTLKTTWLDSDLSKAEELERVEQYILDYNITAAVVDEGYGDTNRENLQRGVGTRNPDGYDNVYGCMYGNVKKKDGVTWNRKGANKEYFTVNRTYMMESMVEDFKRGRIKIPKDDLDFGTKSANGTKLLDELTAPYTDRVETADGKKKLRVVSDWNDDAFHSYTYAWIAANYMKSRRTVSTISSHTRPGYE